MNRVSLVKSELINRDANGRMSEMVTLEYSGWYFHGWYRKRAKRGREKRA